MSLEQVATNAAVSNLITQIFHLAILLVNAVMGYLLMRQRQQNQRQQEEIDECRRIISSIDEKMDELMEGKE